MDIDLARVFEAELLVGHTIHKAELSGPLVKTLLERQERYLDTHSTLWCQGPATIKKEKRGQKRIMKDNRGDETHPREITFSRQMIFASD